MSCCIRRKPLDPQIAASLATSFKSFEEALTKSGRDPLVSALKEPFSRLHATFSQPVRLQYPRDIHPLYEQLSQITDTIANTSFESLHLSWQKVLKELHGRKIYRIHHGSISFDTTFAQIRLKTTPAELQKKLTVSSFDVKNTSNRKRLVRYITETDREAFGTYLQSGFLDRILRSSRILCFAAQNYNNEIVGVLWGFTATDQNQPLFHVWELSRKASLAKMGIGKQLIECARKEHEKKEYASIKTATLNVDKSNTHAAKLYQGEGFIATDKDGKAVKTFMATSLALDRTASLDAKTSKTVVRCFVLATVPKCKLVFYEIARQCAILWRYCWYR